MAVLLDVALVGTVLAHHAGHIAHPRHLAADRIAEDDLVGYRLLAVLRGRYVQGHLLVGVADAAAHGSNTLCLQTAEEHLLADAVGLQSLPVDIKGYLLLVLTIDAHVSHRRYAAQTVGEAVGIVL